MTITQRLWLMAGVLISMLIGLGGYALSATQGMATKGDEIAQMTELRGQLNQLMRFSASNREQMMLALQHNPSDQSIASLHDHPVERHLEAFGKIRGDAKALLEVLQQNALIKQQFDTEYSAFLAVRTTFSKEAQDKGFSLIKEGQYHQATEHLLKVVNPLFNKLDESGKQLLAVISQKQTQLRQESDHLNDSVLHVLILVSLLASVIGLGMAWMAIRSVKSSISDVSEVVIRSAQQMSFTMRLSPRNDEFAQLSLAVNQLFAGLQQGFNETNQVVNALSQGDMSKRVSGQYVGDLDVLKQGVNQSADSIAKVINELSTAMSGLSAGQFKVALNTNAAGIYGDILQNSATAMTSINGVVSDINEIMHQMALANFDARVNAQANGDLATLKNNVNKSMEQTSSVIKSIVEVVSAQAEGDLTKMLPDSSYHGQFHDLKNALTFSVQKLRDIVKQAVDASSIVSEASVQVSQGANDLSGRVQQQASALEETSATMNEMAAAVQNNTGNARKVAELAHQVQHQAGAGVDVMQQTISAMQSIKESSSKIADIVTIIDGIAFQTNLLALNAAVEAARAGDHGRGFAVVAGEVRALAQKSADAAKDIKHLINDSVTRIEAGTQLADKSGEMLSGVTGSIEQVAEMIEAIANASNEQAQGIHQVHQAVSEIDRVTQENAALVEETTAAAESLSSEANNLRSNMAFFKTGTVSNAHYHAKPASKSMKPASKGLPTPTSGEWSHF